MDEHKHHVTRGMLPPFPCRICNRCATEELLTSTHTKILDFRKANLENLPLSTLDLIPLLVVCLFVVVVVVVVV